MRRSNSKVRTRQYRGKGRKFGVGGRPTKWRGNRRNAGCQRKPTQHREAARRLAQIERGQLTEANGLVR